MRLCNLEKLIAVLCLFVCFFQQEIFLWNHLSPTIVLGALTFQKWLFRLMFADISKKQPAATYKLLATPYWEFSMKPSEKLTTNTIISPTLYPEFILGVSSW